MRVSDFDFELPEELVAQHPPRQRGESRLLVLNRQTGAIRHATFSRLPEFLHAGDRLVLNDTRVFPARLLGHRVPSGGAVECLLVRPLTEARTSTPDLRIPDPGSRVPSPEPRALSPEPRAPSPEFGAPSPELQAQASDRIPDPGSRIPNAEMTWEALMHPGQKLKPGARVVFEGDGVAIEGEVLERRFHGRRTIRLQAEGGVMEAIERIGHIPLPPYIKRADTADDRERYQTVFAREAGSIAAPTAGLHFTPHLLKTLSNGGVRLVYVTLHVGYGTFKPVRVDDVEEHRVDPETFSVAAAAARELVEARTQKGRIIAVGTTTTRVLESLPMQPDARDDVSGSTDLFIRPGHQFRLVDGLVTNFHLPRSSLLMLVAAFAGHEHVMAAYREAVARGYRFYSYGDAMLIV